MIRFRVLEIIISSRSKTLKRSLSSCIEHNENNKMDDAVF